MNEKQAPTVQDSGFISHHSSLIPTQLNAAPSDSPLWGVLASLLVFLGAAWIGAWLVQDARQQADAWGTRRSLDADYRQRWGATFELTERSGAKYGAASFKGHVTVVAFFYSRCAQSCPMLMQALQMLQPDLSAAGIRLACISVESSHDTQAVLAEYARQWGAGPDWLFLTGDVETVRRLAAAPFFASLQVKPDEPVGRYITHSSRLYLLNKNGEICNQVEVVRRADPSLEESPFEIDRTALRRVKLAALDLESGHWLGLADLPHVNFVLNGTSALLLLFGVILVRLRLLRGHAVAMCAAGLVSALFLVSYLYYHRHAGDTRFAGAGAWRPIYFGLLITHVCLAMVTVPLAAMTFYLAARGQFARHRRLARWTLPIWLYVSVSGLLVYLFLYQWFPS
jgi:uncharacterized membrane protein YozB (DUF420 family)/cytochrome oxidase Cu insertion factor (SCO1/SenC/PrrC family)